MGLHPEERDGSANEERLLPVQETARTEAKRLRCLVSQGAGGLGSRGPAHLSSFDSSTVGLDRFSGGSCVIGHGHFVWRVQMNMHPKSHLLLM